MEHNEALEKVRKLLALAKDRGANMHEAEVAAQTAQKIMSRYRIDEAMLEARAEKPAPSRAETGAIVRATLWRAPGNRAPAWAWPVVSAVCQENRVKPWLTGAVMLEGAGLQEDLDATSYMIAFLVNEIGRLADRYMATTGKGGGRRAANSFRLGAAQGVISALVRARKIANDEARLEAQEPRRALELDYEAAMASGDAEAVLALDARARALSTDAPTFALARVESALATVSRDAEVLRVRLETWTDENLKLGKPRRTRTRAGDVGAYQRGVLAGSSVNVSNANRRLS